MGGSSRRAVFLRTLPAPSTVRSPVGRFRPPMGGTTARGRASIHPLRLVGGIFSGLLASCGEPKGPEERAIGWLLQQRSEDGRWRSKTYTVLGTGDALTPLILLALGPNAEYREILRSIRPAAEYPNYARACLLLACRRHGAEDRIAGLAAELESFQLVEKNGWDPSDPEYGGWDYGAVQPKKPMAQRPDLSTTAFAIHALRVAGRSPESDALRKARRFVERCQNYPGDGGFIFTPDRTASFQNKAGPSGGPTGFRSYGTATADGLFALICLGFPEESPRVSAARRWVAENPSATVPGLEGLPERWDEGLFFYHAFAAARAGIPFPREALLRRQGENGAWLNPNGSMKEDDPIVATALALLALRPYAP